uniref:Uncharacterized protein n=1 Tax=Glossina brevipalpis TaxID=37001 RepID=A0A1A9WLP4_9MUSC
MFAKYANFLGLRLARCFTQGPQKPGRCCPEIIEPRCNPKNKDICKGFSMGMTERSYVHLPKDTAWEFPECCGNICRGMPIRLDELYYKESDKKTRKYKQTWTTAPSLRTEVCEIYPPICRAVPMPERPKRKNKCKPNYTKGCKQCRLMPKPIRNMCPKDPPDCRNPQRRFKTASKEKKQLTPYPCYSECKNCGSLPPQTEECKCLDRPAIIHKIYSRTMFRKLANNIGFRFARSFTYSQPPPGRCCPEIVEPKCDPKDKDLCKKHTLKITDQSLFYIPKDTAWEYPECCGNVCPGMAVRMDTLYYKTTDKKTRKYTQTWKTAPALRIEVAEIYPPLCRAVPMPTRPLRGRKPQSACRFARYTKKLLPCRLLPKPLCNMCPKERTDCRHVYRKYKCPAKGVKVPTPYPSYSECKQCRRDPPRGKECKCLDRPALCVAWERFRRREAGFKPAEPDIGPFPGKIETEYKICE